MIRLTRLIGMLKATPLLLPLFDAMAVLMPITSASRLTSGPPLEPGLIAASVCRKSLMRIVLPRLIWTTSRARTQPVVARDNHDPASLDGRRGARGPGGVGRGLADLHGNHGRRDAQSALCKRSPDWGKRGSR